VFEKGRGDTKHSWLFPAGHLSHPILASEQNGKPPRNRFAGWGESDVDLKNMK
jgi:hypothetical protein